MSESEGLREALVAITHRGQRPAGRGEYVEHIMDDGHGPDDPCAICAFLAAQHDDHAGFADGWSPHCAACIVAPMVAQPLRNDRSTHE